MNAIRVRALPLAMGMLGLLHGGLASAEVTTNAKYPIEITDYVACPNNVDGELVALSGDIHQLFIVNISSANKVTMKSHFNPQGVSGVGQTTGDSYRGTGVTSSMCTFDGNIGFPYTFTYVNNFRLIGQGSGANYTVHMNTHLTINANGIVTATVDNARIDCK